MRDIHQSLSIALLLMMTISGTLATVSVKGNNGSVLIAKTNNQGNVKINQDIDDFTDVKLQSTNPYLLTEWGSKDPLKDSYQLQHEQATVKPRNQPHPSTGWGYRDSSKDTYQIYNQHTISKPRNQVYPSTGWGYTISKNVKRPNPTKSLKSNNQNLLTTSRPRDEKINPISIKNNNGTILVAGKNNQGNTKIDHDISHFDAFN